MSNQLITPSNDIPIPYWLSNSGYAQESVNGMSPFVAHRYPLKPPKHRGSSHQRGWRVQFLTKQTPLFDR